MRQVLVVGDRMFDGTGATIGTVGYFIDLTARLDGNRNETLHGALSKLVETRAAIEQAKGVLMFVYGITAEQAFGVLRWRSQETHTKIRTLAAKLVTAVTAGSGAPVVVRTRFDHLLLTAHELPDPPAGTADCWHPHARFGRGTCMVWRESQMRRRKTIFGFRTLDTRRQRRGIPAHRVVQEAYQAAEGSEVGHGERHRAQHISLKRVPRTAWRPTRPVTLLGATGLDAQTRLRYANGLIIRGM
ncbi:ANTAR domain-containing protein [Nocardia sp. SC052]|uniref:ANTAR domain-containing protein n=1 Tax=Nocardia sichangensis TaxID=3385975 RepID=UPI0039A379AA